MSDTPHALIRDTLAYLKDPLLPKQSSFATREECALLQKKPTPPARIPIPAVVKPEPPKTRVMNEVDPPKVENVTPPVQVQPPPQVAAESQPQIKKILQKIVPGVKLVDQVP